MIAAKLMGAPWLGHGRMLEAALSLICLIYGASLLLIASAAFDSQATRDIAWAGNGHLLAIPFLIKAIFTGYGLLANINGWWYSQGARFCGALVGSFLWAGIFTKFVLVGATFSFGSVCCIVFFVGSIRIMGMAAADLPKPGSPGAM